MPERRGAQLAAWLQAQWWQRNPSLGARLLQPLSWLYAALAALQRWRQRPYVPLPVPVIVVGNLIAGGAGKTPSVVAIVEWLATQGWRPGVVSRGHGARFEGVRAVTSSTAAADCGDEPLLIRLRTGAPVYVGRDRVAAVRALCAAEPAVDIVVSDDGLQHHRLARDVQIIVFDDRGVGNGLLLPAGPLREGLPHKAPPRSLVLYNAASPSTPLPGFVVQRELGAVKSLADWWSGVPPKAEAWDLLRERRVLGVAGIASPERFFSMLEARGLKLDRLALDDHHRFDTLPWPADTGDVVLTEKDAVKLSPDRVGTARIWVVALDFAVPPAFFDTLRGLLSTAPRKLP